MRITKRKLEVLALQGSTIANACKLKLLLKALRYADNHVMNEGAGKSLLCIGFLRIVNTLNEDLLALYNNLKKLRERTLKLALGTLT